MFILATAFQFLLNLRGFEGNGKVSIRQEPGFLDKINLLNIIRIAWNNNTFVHRLTSFKLTQNLLINLRIVLQMIILIAIDIAELDKLEIQLVTNNLRQSLSVFIIVTLQTYNKSPGPLIKIVYKIFDGVVGSFQNDLPHQITKHWPNFIFLHVLFHLLVCHHGLLFFHQLYILDII